MRYAVHPPPTPHPSPSHPLLSLFRAHNLLLSLHVRTTSSYFFINVRLVVFLNTNVIDLYLTLKPVINKLLKTSQILRQIVFNLPVNISELHLLHGKCTNFGNA